MTDVLTLGWGPGVGSRLLSPGLPDLLLTNGEHLGWLAREGLYVRIGEQVHLVSAPNPVGLSASPSAWVVLHQEGAQWVVTRLESASLTLQRWVFEVRGLCAGAAWGVLDHGTHREVLDLGTGQSIKVPDGATDARPQPFTDAPGLVWLVQDGVYRMKAQGGVRAAGSLPRQPDSWAAGPAGSAIFALGDDVWGMAPSGAPIALPGVLWEGLRFSPDGKTVLGSTPAGIALRSLLTGEELWQLEERVLPVGFGPGPLFLDETTGRVCDSAGLPQMEGFSPSAALLCGERLYGPGGTAWDLGSGERLWAHAPLSAEYLVKVGERLVCLTDEITLYDLDGHHQSSCPLPLDPDVEGWPVEVSALGPDSLYVALEDGALEVFLDGRHRSIPQRAPAQAPESPLRWSEPDEAPMLSLSGSDWGWPVASDDAVLIGETVWTWTEDGMLAALVTRP
jgi:hypothetical protein